MSGGGGARSLFSNPPPSQGLFGHKGLRCWELDVVLIAVTQIVVHHRCFEVFWSKIAEKSTP